LQFKKAEGSFINPVHQWGLKWQQYPLLVIIARRVFSVVGITIAKNGQGCTQTVFRFSSMFSFK
jgi:hypothetical protein